MKSLRVLSVLVLLASCFDEPGTHIVGTLPVTPIGGGEQAAGGGSAMLGGGAGTGGGTGLPGGGTGLSSGGGTATPGPCDCKVADLTLTMSWECYRARFFFERQLNPTCGDDIESSSACGLTVLEFHGPQMITVRDSSGATVGQQIFSDTSDYVCPDDASLHAMIARGGVFPDAGCGTLACDCVDGGIVCP